MKQKKLMKYTKKSENCPKFEQGVINNVGRPHKKIGHKKNKNLSRVPELGTRGRGTSPSARTGHSGKPANFLARARSAQPTPVMQI
jgi:hypothetical protein